MNHDDWYFWAAMRQGSVTMPIFQSLEAFWPGLLSLVGDTEQAMKTILNYHQVWSKSVSDRQPPHFWINKKNTTASVVLDGV